MLNIVITTSANVSLCVLGYATAVCYGSGLCPDNIMCTGGTTCGTTCVPGYTFSGGNCVGTWRGIPALTAFPSS